MRKKLVSLLLTAICVSVFATTPVQAAGVKREKNVATIEMGTYPQSEVTGDALTPKILNAEYNEAGYCDIDGVRYKKLGIAGQKDPSILDYSYYEHWGIDMLTHLIRPPKMMYSTLLEKEISYEEYHEMNTTITSYRYFKCEPITWNILYEEDGQLLVMAEQILDCQQAGDERFLKWRNGELEAEPKRLFQEWLNETFINEAFSEEEQTKIVTASAVEWKNEDLVQFDDGRDQEDKVFLPSYDQAETIIIPYMNKKDIDILATEYAIADGAEDHSLMLSICHLKNREIVGLLRPAATNMVSSYEEGVCPIMAVNIKDNCIMGDANYNGIITLQDAKDVLKSALGIMDKTYSMDLNEDEDVNLEDALGVLKLALGINQ